MLMESGVQPRARGWNFQIEQSPVSENASATAEILRRFVNRTGFGEIGERMSGAEIKVYFGESPRWFLSIEPRSGDLETSLTYVHANVHISEGYDSPPSAEEVTAECTGFHGEFMQMLNDLFG
jgi:hypothetical protein